MKSNVHAADTWGGLIHVGIRRVMDLSVQNVEALSDTDCSY